MGFEIPGYDTEFMFNDYQRRIGMASVIERLLKYPVHYKRWHASPPLTERLVRALRKRAAEHHVSTDDAIAYLTITAFHEIMKPDAETKLPSITLKGDGDDPDPASFEEYIRTIRRLVNEKVTEYLLGPDWRQPHTPVPHPVEHAERKAFLEIDFALRSSVLSEDDRLVIEALKEAEGDEEEAARRLGRSTKAVWKKLERIRKKLA